jgi:hypothetical protein
MQSFGTLEQLLKFKKKNFKKPSNFSQKKTKKPSKSPPRGPGGGGPNLIFLPEFLFILVRSPCKNLNSYDNPLWYFNNGGVNKITTTR